MHKSKYLRFCEPITRKPQGNKNVKKAKTKKTEDEIPDTTENNNYSRNTTADIKESDLGSILDVQPKHFVGLVQRNITLPTHIKQKRDPRPSFIKYISEMFLLEVGDKINNRKSSKIVECLFTFVLRISLSIILFLFGFNLLNMDKNQL